MELQLEQIREQQKETWNKFSPGWRKWDSFTMNWLKPLGDEIIRSLQLKPTDTVLDVAGGTGEPGLSIARIVTQGKVIITDLAEGMLQVARDNAARKEITNYDTLACDVCALPFENETFDAISCRLGFMYFPDMLLAAKEMMRVLKPGGRIATAVWGTPDKNFWGTAAMGVINKTMQLPAPPPGAPGLFRCASPGFIAHLFQQAGFKNISETEVTGQVPCGTKETYWDFTNDVVAPVVAALSKADQATKDKIKQEVFRVVDERCPDNQAALDYGAVIIYGEK
ncbi:class I SAM-dependent methyltransferase [Adhaeribacter pallidiroseus]|uniref:Demethylmenaquinone methyltransferase n=1 Tax=Adhaeribacter pallidiroseus TaxID=2072847 RepID=A0A369QQN3_9BACT|nr:class I SAM-dependent methyltransferase [Adhaeribacter pallidiroseus]RDC65537.1 Demethylmenaquinone methyltransferase [Adhaeribacter pallidiroseus]